jgi:nicotinate-nucleotide adenylyltransferase
MAVIGIYGGAFSPPHVGHALVATWILATGRADLLVFVPAANHPFGKKMAPFADRVDMCDALVLDLGRRWRVAVSDIEASLPAPNYSINLLRAFQDLNPNDHVRFVMGADNLAKRADWYGFDDIVREFDPIYVNRQGVVLPEGVVVDSPMFPDISSTTVRDRLAAGLPVDHLLTREVADLVRRRNLYAGG